ncbi:MAG: glutamate--tRNA ligase, partial [Geodermatophilaceae bacterium]|nr:glutamate--tRNA ligase [Geodermatophilaceae bacterium]
AKVLGPDAVPILDAATEALAAVPTWDAPAIEAALKAALVDGLKLKPRKAFAPIRVAVSGRTISPPLYESLELLGRERSLARLKAATR